MKHALIGSASPGNANISGCKDGYTVTQLAALAGISTRTLRYYDQIGLLVPRRAQESGYRIYGQEEVDVLQQILFYKRMGLELSTIEGIIKDPAFNQLEALKAHLDHLEKEEQHIRLLIDTVKKTIQKEEGTRSMTDQEKFTGLKEEIIKENEEKYGQEIREKYGDSMVEKSNQKMLDLTQAEYDAMMETERQILSRLKDAVTSGASASDAAGREIAMLHKEWLSYTWPTYNPMAHLGLAEMYVADERFKSYYDKEAKGCAKFLRDAIHEHIK